MHRGAWLTVAGVCALALISLSFEDKGSVIFTNRMLNLAIIVGLAMVGCLAVYKAGDR